MCKSKYQIHQAHWLRLFCLQGLGNIFAELPSLVLRRSCFSRSCLPLHLCSILLLLLTCDILIWFELCLDYFSSPFFSCVCFSFLLLTAFKPLPSFINYCGNFDFSFHCYGSSSTSILIGILITSLAMSLLVFLQCCDIIIIILKLTFNAE